MLKVFLLVFAASTGDQIWGVYPTYALCLRALTVAGKLEPNKDYYRLSCTAVTLKVEKEE